MYLYYLFSESSEWTNLDEALLSYVSEERRQKIHAYKFSKDKKLSLYAALLLPYACADQYDLAFEEVDPLWPQAGKPYLQSHPEICFSIAHSGSCAAVAVSDQEIGLDAELIDKAPMKIMKRVFSPNEADRVHGSAYPDLEFFRIWTRKESFGKYLGTGLSTLVLKTDTFLPEHLSRISEGVLTPQDFYSRSEYLTMRKTSDPELPALYYSVYGKKEQVNLVPVSVTTLLEYYLLYI
ncbi:MAG: 4'-phosphopantetheinyl transferase superfamily protein [Lachnospiraceae bacterium]|nr:4'-phosphopantetheinyl transferase superfamily protein [Lachnospiraceae bacterium]